MIPRFIIRNAEKIVPALQQLGYELRDSIIPKDVLVIGNAIQSAPLEEQEKARLIRSYDGNLHVKDIIDQAKLQLRWQNVAGDKTQVVVGTKDVGITVTRLGILIDSFLIPIDQFKGFRRMLAGLNYPGLASHTPMINPSIRFMTVGCADYSLDDLDQIIAAYDKLLEPTT